MKDNLSYDQALSRIEEIVLHLEDENKSIDELSSLVKEASELVQHCKQKLKMTEEDIQKAFGDE